MKNVKNRVPCDNWFCTFNQRGYCLNISVNDIYRKNNEINCNRINDNNINMDEHRRKEDLYYEEELKMLDNSK